MTYAQRRRRLLKRQSKYTQAELDQQSIELHDRVRKRNAMFQKAKEAFEALSDYEKGQIVVWGTAFTTWEDEGDDFCEALNLLAKEWAAKEWTNCP